MGEEINEEEFPEVECRRPQQGGGSCGCDEVCMFADGIDVDERILEALVRLEKKYFNLVWYARKSPEDIHVPEIEKPMKVVEFLYEEEVENIKGENGDWHHGFNSGALAAFRYLMSIVDFGIQHAEESFPELDT